MIFCEFGACDGHIKKFSNCLEEALYNAASDYSDDSCGDSDFGVCALFLIHDNMDIPADHWGGREKLTVGAGSWLTLWVDSQGHVALVSHASAQEARDAYDDFAYRWALVEEAAEMAGAR